MILVHAFPENRTHDLDVASAMVYCYSYKNSTPASDQPVQETSNMQGQSLSTVLGKKYTLQSACAWHSILNVTLKLKLHYGYKPTNLQRNIVLVIMWVVLQLCTDEIWWV